MAPARSVGGAMTARRMPIPAPFPMLRGEACCVLIFPEFVEHQDADGVQLDAVVDLVPGLERLDRVIRGGLLVEEPEHHRIGHDHSPPAFP